MDPLTIVINLTIVLMLVAVNGFFVAAEFSLVSVRSTRIDQLVQEGNRVARIIQRAKADPNRFLSASQIGITIASLALGAVAEPTVATLIMAAFHGLHVGLSEVILHAIAWVITFTFITYMHIVLGEFIPKALALQRTETTVLFTSLPLEAVAVVCTPFIHVLNKSGQWLLDRMGIEASPHHHLVYSEEELKLIVSASQEVGVIEAHEHDMLHKVFAFSDKVAREVMVPRPDMKALNVDISYHELLREVNEQAHTRFPVYEDNIDNVLGVFHAKDLFRFLEEKPVDQFNMRDLVREVPFVPESKAVDDLLTELKKGKTQIAIVMDEFGGTAGLVTLEDLLEEIVGEIADEFDEEETEIEHLPDGQHMIDGRYRIVDFNDRFGTDLGTEDYDTMAGLVFGQLGREPQVGDQVELDGVHLEVFAMEGHRITRLKLGLKKEPEVDGGPTINPVSDI